MQNDERGIRVKDPVSLGHEEGRSRMTKNGTVAKRDPITGSSGRPRMSVGLKNPGKWKLDGALERINHQKRNMWVRISGFVLYTAGHLGGSGR